jgi:hypothetical protein
MLSVLLRITSSDNYFGIFQTLLLMIDEQKKKFEDTTIICFIKTQNCFRDEIDIHVCLKFSMSNRTDTFDSQQRQSLSLMSWWLGPIL